MLIGRDISCPYCGEIFETHIDLSAGTQDYVEDCYVCCRPISFRTVVDPDGNLIQLEVCREDD
ncbi:MAG: CPXCG motif-containing cysteine-rich protein [Acidiferrobacterales bacterium]|nr:CPXCG motif-containing cysteine-rich protein [Acidiferrobacterales bacterium]